MVEKVINPYINTTIIRYTEVIKSIVGYGIDTVVESYNREHDAGIKVYNCKANRDFLYQNLSMYARDLMMAMYHFVNKDYQYVIITYEKVLELYNEYSKRRYDDTIRELVKYNIIDCKDKSQGQFWYNPIFFAAGNRLKMYPECGLKVNTTTI